MVKAALKDKMLKLIIEDISVTRPEQISRQLNIDNNTVLSLLKEMEQSGHVQLLTVSGGIHVIVLKLPGRHFYKSSESYAGLNKETTEAVESSGVSKKTVNRTIIGILIAILLALLFVFGYKQGWF